MKNLPLVSIIIPTKILSNYLIQEGLPGFSQQSFKNFEVIILPDKKDCLAQELTNKYQWLTIIATGKNRKPSEKRNLGVNKAIGQIIAFIDDDAYPQTDWLEKAVRILKEKSIYSVCGPGLIPQGVNFWETVFDHVFKTWAGSGGLSYRFSKNQARYVDDYPAMNFFILKKIYHKLKGFDKKYWPGEDSKLCNKLIKLGTHSIYYSPEIVVYHHRRNSLKKYLQQQAGYGYHRGLFFMQKDKNSLKLIYLFPSLFVSYLLLLTVISLNSKSFSILFIPIEIYFLLLLFLFIKILSNTKNLLTAFLSPLVLFITHVVYGLMFIVGAMRVIANPE